MELDKLLESIIEDRELDDEKLLNKNNKQMQHLQRLKEIKTKQQELKRSAHLTLHQASKQFADDLISMQDLFLQ